MAEQYSGSEVASLTNVIKDFPHQRVLHDSNFGIPEGSVTLICGPSGSGKSTSVRMIPDLEQPTEGEVHLFGESIRSMRSKDLRKIIGAKVSYVQQDPALESGLTVYENLILTAQELRPARRERPAIRKRANEMVEAFGIEKLANRNANRALSGGEKAKVALARALVKRPELLILDEPTSAVDPKGTVDIFNRLQTLNDEEGITMIIISHDDEMARTIEDVLARRTRALLLDARASVEMAKPVADLLAQELAHDEAWKEQQIKDYTELANRYLVTK